MTDNRIVQAPHKSGIYIGEIQQYKGENVLLKVLAVLKHPNQGDLHHPKQADVPFFHERKALAENEKVWVPAAIITDYKEEVPDYKDSLKKAVQQLADNLQNQNDEYAKKALRTLEVVKEEYRF
ncbi:kinase-associated lipoprotein B [Bacillus piscicola]|uniref:kinase-associated lipoprotein B n=1 Tax=Bacillus piscicola TaxID=1632684 RepID=UPI001F09425D|nr:kinase-associated lipoprotein B [Bacillus piscicola]